MSVWLDSNFWQSATMFGFLDANSRVASYMGYQLLTCPEGFLVVGYQARAYTGGIQYFDVSPCLGKSERHACMHAILQVVMLQTLL